jgi:hypothetical protein
MKKQYLLANEVIRLLKKEVLSNDKKGRKLLKELAKVYQFWVCGIRDPQSTISLLDRCAGYLRDKGIYVYYKVTKKNGKPIIASFIVGECGRVFEKLDWQATYINDLLDFIEKCEHELPPDAITTKETLMKYARLIVSHRLVGLLNAYIGKSKRDLKRHCALCREFAEEVDAYLDSIIDLRRLHAISLIL